MTTMTWKSPTIAPAWRLPSAVTLVLVSLLLLSYRETAMTMVGIWSRSETFTHAFVVPPIVAWLIWRQRDVLRTLEPQPQPWMILPILLLAVAWWLGDTVSVNAVTQLAMTGMLVATVPLVLGWRVTNALLFPLAFLFFAVPIGEFMTPTLMHYTADFTVSALRLTGIPVYREGQQFVIPSGHWSVIDECSGIRYLMASFMVGSLFAYLNYRSYRRRLAFMAMSIVVPIVANWLRAYMVVMLAHLSGNRIATGVDHILYGWVFFGIVIMALFFAGARWAEDDPVAAVVPEGQGRSASGVPHAAWPVLLVAGLALLAAQLPHLLQRESASVASTAAPALRLPDTLAPGWRADAQDLSTWRPTFVEPAAEVQRTFAGPEGRVAVHLAYYRHQSETSKLVSSVNVLVAMRSPWNQLTTGKHAVPTLGRAIEWSTAKLLGGEGATDAARQHLTVWRLYWIGGYLTSNDIVAKLHQAWQRVRGEPDDAAAILLYADAPVDADAERLLTDFIAANFGPLQQLLTQARASR
jgi:exosortase A